jgi:hypothetical protein
MNNFVVAVVSCEKYLHTRVKTVQKFCLSNIQYFVFTGTCKKQLVNHIPLDCSDDYFLLRQKTQALLKWFINTPYDYLVKCDDDTFIYAEELLTLPHSEYCGAFSTFSAAAKNKEFHLDYIYKKTNRRQNLSYYDDITFDFEYASGGCYILSKQAAIKMYQCLISEALPSIIQEDITIGYLAHILNIPKTNYGISTQWYDMTTFSIHPCSQALFAILSTKQTLEQRKVTVEKFLLLNNYYQNYFDLK